MRAAILACSLALSVCSAAVSFAQDDLGALAPARAGLVQCYSPSERELTCTAMTSYEFRANGEIESLTIGPFPGRSEVTMRLAGLVSERDGVVCGSIRDVDVNGATYELRGQPVPNEEAVELREALMVTARPQVCANLEGTTQTSRGMYREQSFEYTDHVIWVRPDDGYRVVAEQSAK